MENGKKNPEIVFWPILQLQYYLVPIYNSQNFIIIASREIYVADRNGKTTFPPKSFLASSHKTQWGEKLKQSAIRLYVPQV